MKHFDSVAPIYEINEPWSKKVAFIQGQWNGLYSQAYLVSKTLDTAIGPMLPKLLRETYVTDLLWLTSL